MAQAHSGKFRSVALQQTAGRWAMVGLIAMAATAFGAAAWADGPPGGRAGHHAGMGGPGPFGPGLFGGSPERIARGVDRMLDGLQATDAQRTQVKQIAVAAAKDLQAQREAGRGLFERNRALFTAPVVDANAAEQLRQQMLAQHDQASRRTLQAMLEISRVLTPEQRATLAQRMKNHRWHGGPPHDSPRPAS
ncbi:MAG: Spy/CpxP family protein refolding chaperone [Burkholderiaceae bacterium]|nr:Spy/CpxP family protein refolding chaperone [Burkholderiaceae bacterium]